MTAAISRNKMQEKALFCLYDILIYIEMKEPFEVMDIVSGIMDTPYSDVDPYVKKTIIFALKNYSLVIDEVNKHLVKWTFDRLGKIEQAAYLLAYSLYYGDEKVDKRIAISVVLNLMDKYDGEIKNKRAMNAVLDKVLNDEGRK